MWFFVLAAFCTLFSNVVAEFIVSTPEGPVSAWLGRVATIPCWLTPSQNAEDLEVRWYRPKVFDMPVLLYKDRQIQESSQWPRYANRTSLGLREAKSEGLKGADVTLKLGNVTMEDQGSYICYVSSEQGYESATVDLRVNVLGSPPLLSAVRMQDGSVNMSCVSHGWQPRPRLKWSNGTHTLQPGLIRYGAGAQDLVSVHSWLLASPASSPWVSCSVSLPEGDEREGRVDLQNLPQVQASGSLLTAVIILVLLLLIATAVIGVLYWKRGSKSPERGTTPEEMQPLLSKEKMDIETMKKCGVDVTLDYQTAHAYLKVTPNGKIVRDNFKEYPSDEHPYILGKSGFTTGGRAYWEVGLGDETTGVKESWWVGVGSGSVRRQGPATPHNGFWFLSSDKEDGLRLNTIPHILLPALPRPQTLGVYLDYDKGELSFISVKDRRLIVTVATVFTGEVFPLFNPGAGDKAPMTMLDIPPKPDPGPADKIGDTKSTTSTPVEPSETNRLLADSKHPNDDASKTHLSTVP